MTNLSLVEPERERCKCDTCDKGECKKVRVKVEGGHACEYGGTRA